MNSQQIQHALIHGLTRTQARKYAIFRNTLISRTSGLEIAAVDRKHIIIDEYKNDNPTSMRGTYDHLKTRYHNISMRDIEHNYKNDNLIQAKRPPKKRYLFNQNTVATKPFHICEIDLTLTSETWKHEMIQRTRKPFYVLTFIDSYTRYAEAEVVLQSKSSRNVLNAFERILNRLPIRPLIISCDNGTEFKGVFKQFLEDNNIKIILSNPYKPSDHGKVERFNRVLKTSVDRYLERDEDKVFSRVLLNEFVNKYNRTYHSVIKMKPVEALDNPVPEIVPDNKQDNEVFNIGDEVRVSLYVIDKDYRKRLKFMTRSVNKHWSDDTYIITRIRRNQHNENQQYKLNGVTRYVYPYQIIHSN